MSSDTISISYEVFERLYERYPDEERHFRALAYFIHTEYAKEYGHTFRERIDRLKWVRGKLNDVK